MRHWWDTRTAFTRSPVMQAELAHLRKNPVPRGWQRQGGGRPRLIPLVAQGVGLLLLGFLSSLVGASLGFLLLAPFAALFHLWGWFMTLILTADSVAREKRASTWDLLVLTSMDARQLVLGKWAATFLHMRPYYVLLGILWAGAALGLGSLARMVAEADIIYPMPRDLAGVALSTVLASTSVFAITLANFGLTGAVGVLTSFLNNRRDVAAVMSFALRVVVPGSFAALLMAIRSMVSNPYPNPNETMLYLLGMAMLDNGLLLGAAIAASDIISEPFASLVIPAMFLALLVYVLLTFLALYLAERLAVRQGVTPSKSRTEVG